MKSILKIILIVLISTLFFTVNAESDEQIVIHYFYEETCDNCSVVTGFLNDEYQNDSNIIINKYNISEDQEAENLFLSLIVTFNRDVSSVPYVVVGGKDLQSTYEITGELELVIEYYRSNPNFTDIVEKVKNDEVIISSDFLAIDFSGERTIKLPIIGEVKLANFSLILGAIFIGLIDGFNPCAMWILVFLITLLINMKNRKKMWILGLAFILTSGLIYYIIMMSWLQIAVKLALIRAFQIIIGVLALIMAIFSIRHFYKQMRIESGCVVSNPLEKRKLMVKIKKIINQNNLWLALVGIISVAISVNIIELACSAGLPVVYSTMLAFHELSIFESALYILVYVIFFIFDDLLIFTIAAVSFRVTGISNKYAKYSNLIG
ncbi:MAG: hypothetical protein WCY80_04665 [Candidatus Izemoplasmatales bacterium]